MRGRENNTPNQNEVQKSQVNNLYKKSQGALSCNHSLMPHLSINTIAKLTNSVKSMIMPKKLFIGTRYFRPDCSLYAYASIRLHQVLIL